MGLNFRRPPCWQQVKEFAIFVVGYLGVSKAHYTLIVGSRCILLEITNFFIFNDTPMWQYLKMTVFKQNVQIWRDFLPI